MRAVEGQEYSEQRSKLPIHRCASRATAWMARTNVTSGARQLKQQSPRCRLGRQILCFLQPPPLCLAFQISIDAIVTGRQRKKEKEKNKLLPLLAVNPVEKWPQAAAIFFNFFYFNFHFSPRARIITSTGGDPAAQNLPELFFFAALRSPEAMSAS